MLIDLRQHIITLVAVFLALAVGIVFGGSFINGSSIERRVSGMLEHEFNKIRAENQNQQMEIDDLNEQLRRHQEFESSLVPTLVGQRLVGQSVAIIQTGDYDEATVYAKRVLMEAGADVSSVTVLSLDSSSAEAKAAEAVRTIDGMADTRDPVNRILEIIANCVALGANPNALNILEAKGLISGTGSYDARVGAVVLVGGCKGDSDLRPHDIDAVLVEKLHSNNVTVVGVEPAHAGTSYIPVYHDEGISTVDDIDAPMGQVALVYILKGDSGDFGVKKTAERLVQKDLELNLWQKKSRR